MNLRYVERMVETSRQGIYIVWQKTRVLQQYGETPQPDGYDGPTTYSWQDVPLVSELPEAKP